MPPCSSAPPTTLKQGRESFRRQAWADAEAQPLALAVIGQELDPSGGDGPQERMRTHGQAGAGDGAGPDPLTIVGFGVLVILAGGNAVGIKIVGEELDAFWGATLRFGAAGVIFAALMLAWRILPRGAALAGAILYGLLAFGAAFGIAFVAIPMIGAGAAQVLLGLVPLLTLVLVPLHGLERFRLRAFIGSLVA